MPVSSICSKSPLQTLLEKKKKKQGRGTPMSPKVRLVQVLRPGWVRQQHVMSWRLRPPSAGLSRPGLPSRASRPSPGDRRRKGSRVCAFHAARPPPSNAAEPSRLVKGKGLNNGQAGTAWSLCFVRPSLLCKRQGHLCWDKPQLAPFGDRGGEDAFSALISSCRDSLIL